MNRANSKAFPRPTSQSPSGVYPAQDGATLREYLAGQALVGILSKNAGSNYPLEYKEIASIAVGLADLLLMTLEGTSHDTFVKEYDKTIVAMETEKQPAEAETPQPVISYVPPAQPVRIEAVGQTAPDPKPLEPEYEQPKRDGKTDEDIQF